MKNEMKNLSKKCFGKASLPPLAVWKSVSHTRINVGKGEDFVRFFTD